MEIKRLLCACCMVLFVFSLSSCSEPNSSQEKPITTEIVQNPVTADGAPSENQLPVMTFKSKDYDFGLVIQGEKVSHSFSFTNTGKSDLVISGANASCGCTVPTYSKQPVKPGEKGEIEVVFNSDNREGNQHKTIKVLSNCQPNTIELSIKANIIVNK
jgi:hypothetical protein